MAEKLIPDFESIDFESAVDEIDSIVPRYLQALEALEGVADLNEVPTCIQNVAAYCSRLDCLLAGIQALETDLPLKQIMLDTLQSELTVLEKVYLPINLRIEFSREQCDDPMWKAAEAILSRMDQVLEKLGFTEEHEDRQLLREIGEKNQDYKK